MKLYPALVSLCFVGVTLFGCSKEAPSNAPTENVATAAKGPVTAITVTDDGFVPNQVDVKRGSKATLRFTRTSDKTCATSVAFPELGVEKPLPLNQPVDIDVPTEQARTLTFQCGMGMYKSKVVVN
jgi:plastocyanin domain-containing protein